MTVNILTVSESDPKGVRGIQADIRTTIALGGYAFAVPTFVMGECSGTSCEVSISKPETIAKQMESIFADNKIHAVKIGSVFNDKILNTVVDTLKEVENTIIVSDPDFITRHGQKVFDNSMMGDYKRRLLLKTNTLILNVEEVEILSGMSIRDMNDMKFAASLMRTMGVENVVLKAGQALSRKIVYFVSSDGKEKIFERDRIDHKGTIGAGSLLSSSIILNLAKGADIFEAMEDAVEVLSTAINNSEFVSSDAGWLDLNFNRAENVIQAEDKRKQHK